MSNIIEFNSLNIDKRLFDKFCYTFKIWCEWKIHYEHGADSSTFLRGADELHFLKVYCPKDELISKINKFTKLKAFL